MTRFTDELWQSTLPVYDAILAHPFIDELTDGSLSRDRYVMSSVHRRFQLRTLRDGTGLQIAPQCN